MSWLVSNSILFMRKKRKKLKTRQSSPQQDLENKVKTIYISMLQPRDHMTSTILFFFLVFYEVFPRAFCWFLEVSQHMALVIISTESSF